MAVRYTSVVVTVWLFVLEQLIVRQGEPLIFLYIAMFALEFCPCGSLSFDLKTYNVLCKT